MIKILKDKLPTNSVLRIWIIGAILVMGLGLLFPIFASNDAVFYALVAKHIAQTNDWVDLVYNNQDWLDKPHLPFWLIAISYKIFGISVFSYILPGFIFNLLGAYFTYKLALKLYSRPVALFATLFYLTSLHLMLSAIDVRQEAYLLGEIMPACYFWLNYDELEDGKINSKYLYLGAIFTALAMMTKGVFVLVVIFGGLIFRWLYNKEYNHIISKKWLTALALSFVFILPELICLYLQFDLHPDKIIYGRTHVSGVEFFFWGSQFGRFFDNGPIQSATHDYFAHYFFFVHTYLWAVLPWTLFFIAALFGMRSDFSYKLELPKLRSELENHIYLLGSFIPAFVLFSLTNFQLDHYTNIIIPFGSIITANWVFNKANRLDDNHPIFFIQIAIGFILLSLAFLLAILVLNSGWLYVYLVCCGGALALYLVLLHNHGLLKAIVYPLLAILLAFSFVTLVNGVIYKKYAAGYQISQELKNLRPSPVVDFKTFLNPLAFNSNQVSVTEDPNDLVFLNSPYYLVITAANWDKINYMLSDAQIIKHFEFIPQRKFVPTLFNEVLKTKSTVDILLIQINSEVIDKLDMIEVNQIILKTDPDYLQDIK